MPSPSIFAHCKRSKTGGRNSLGMRLMLENIIHLFIADLAQPRKHSIVTRSFPHKRMKLGTRLPNDAKTLSCDVYCMARDWSVHRASPNTPLFRLNDTKFEVLQSDPPFCVSTFSLDFSKTSVCKVALPLGTSAQTRPCMPNPDDP